ncbi:hypothetical protein BT96DRAFT_1064575 [Gymnopus androsaceus JB14]|uniref:Uncharacterized protein n=1 Tax=Gymnopus androsaceus JB14 TaxID=1447944 RepID=A0A6A4GX82_9AGAR|nr:hypothetical protein BT96DRAFT_1064575 [Gymnopus androsaceus JB14]
MISGYNWYRSHGESDNLRHLDSDSLTTLLTGEAQAQVVIEELGNWINGAFLRYNVNDSVEDSEIPSVEKPTSSRRLANNKGQPSPFTSETENDDFGIIFVVKKDKRASSSTITGSIDILTPRMVFEVDDDGYEGWLLPASTIFLGIVESRKFKGQSRTSQV